MSFDNEQAGTITGHFFAKGYGFVESEGVSYFFHAHEARDFERLSTGDEVVFFPQEHERGPRAIRVRKAE